MKIKRIMIAAPGSGSGKTMITCALLQTWKDMGYFPVSYKCGPDYIDPMFHKKVLGLPSRNLDTFFTGEEKTRELFLDSLKEDDLVIMEGVMGLYDGLGGIQKEGSSYHLACVTKTPVILVVNAKGMGRSVLSLIRGFLADDKEHLIKGVILNRISKSYYTILKPLIEEELHLYVAGYFPDSPQLHMECRHLGLFLPDEIKDVKKQIDMAAGILKETVSLDGILEIAKNAEDIPYIKKSESESRDKKEAPVIAVAYDEAFCFYYEDNLRLLKEYGAELVFFSPVHDKSIPTRCDALLLGGGYPELYAEQLSQNESMKRAICNAFASKMPTVAECGGFLYLHKTLTDQKKKVHKMAGAIPYTCEYKGKLVRFGYMELEEKQSHFLPVGERIRGHEFHYYDSTHNGEDCLGIKPVTQKQYDCVMESESYFIGFPHLYYPSNPVFAETFVKKAIAYKASRQSEKGSV